MLPIRSHLLLNYAQATLKTANEFIELNEPILDSVRYNNLQQLSAYALRSTVLSVNAAYYWAIISEAYKMSHNSSLRSEVLDNKFSYADHPISIASYTRMTTSQVKSVTSVDVLDSLPMAFFKNMQVSLEQQLTKGKRTGSLHNTIMKIIDKTKNQGLLMIAKAHTQPKEVYTYLEQALRSPRNPELTLRQFLNDPESMIKHVIKHTTDGSELKDHPTTPLQPVNRPNKSNCNSLWVVKTEQKNAEWVIAAHDATAQPNTPIRTNHLGTFNTRTNTLTLVDSPPQFEAQRVRLYHVDTHETPGYYQAFTEVFKANVNVSHIHYSGSVPQHSWYDHVLLSLATDRTVNLMNLGVDNT